VGLLYSVARVLARHHINLQLAKVRTLGERVEDTFLIDGPSCSRTGARSRSRLKLLEALAALIRASPLLQYRTPEFQQQPGRFLAAVFMGPCACRPPPLRVGWSRSIASCTAPRELIDTARQIVFGSPESIAHGRRVRSPATPQ
jgi:hypothetical protein